MCVVGVTGSLACGKTTVANMFKEYKAKVINADKIAHKCLKTKKVVKLVVKSFGKEILKGEKIDHQRLADIVFKNDKALKKLERIVHPEVIKEFKEKIKEHKNKKRKGVLVLDVPLLFEAKIDRLVDVTIVVKVTQKTQMLRAVESLGITKTEALRRIKAQMPLQEKIRLADFIIDNSKNIKQTQKQVKAIWQKL